MDTLSHSLVGIAVADIAVNNPGANIQRRTFLLTGVIASNAPDLDALYSVITPAPLGYLLHHRGHSHTIVGLLVIGGLFMFGFRRLSAIQSLPADARRRLWLVMACALGSHLLLDFANVSGIHPFYPFDSRWVFGDFTFTFEPWLWIPLGVAAFLNARSKLGRWRLATMLALLPIGLSLLGLIAAEAVVLLFASGAAFSWVTRRRSPRQRAVTAFIVIAVVLAAQFSLSRIARSRVNAELTDLIRHKVLDTVMIPNPGLPICWWFIVTDGDQGSQELTHLRGTLALLPSWRKAADCPSQQILNRSVVPVRTSRTLVLTEAVRQPIGELQVLAARDCFVRGWLQFGRVPLVEGATIRDLRFDGLLRSNFTVMRLLPTSATRECPKAITEWEPPLAAVLGVTPR